MIKYGLELEGFAIRGKTVVLPPKNWPLDGFPGLVELRTVGGNTLEASFAELFEKRWKLPYVEGVSFNNELTEQTFTGKELAALRKEYSFGKEAQDVHNLYGHEPRNLRGKTLASLQINISNELRRRNEIIVDNKKITEPAGYGLLNIPKIVKNLDTEFAFAIKAAGRQPGMYCIKDGYRLEYRSLPNALFEWDWQGCINFIARIRKCVEGE